MESSGKEEIAEIDELLDVIFTEDISDDEVLDMASEVEHDFHLIDESLDSDNSKQIKETLSNYALLREQSYKSWEANQYDNVNASDKVIEDEEERENKLGEFCENENVDLLDSSITFKVNNISIVENAIELSLYEWVFFKYAEKDCEDLAGFGIDHIIKMEKSEGEWIISADAYYDDLLTETESTSYEEKEASVVSMLSRSVSSVNVISVNNYNVSYTYSADNAVAYSDRYALSYNPNYGNYNSSGGDCANFVSQCLAAGGLPMTSGWYWYSSSNLSSSFISSTRLYNYLSDGWGDAVNNPSSSQILKGNPVFYQSKGASDYFHTSICVGKNSAGTPIINQHNSDRYHVNWNWGSGYNYATVQLYSGSSSTPSGPSELAASRIVYPTNVAQGKAFSLSGTITSNYNITYVKVSIISANGSEAISQTRYPNSKSFSISSVDDDIPFGRLSAGKYTYKIEATDASGTSKVLHTNNFNVGAATPSVPSLNVNTDTSDTVFSWTSSSNATSYNLYIYNSVGAVVISETGITGTSYTVELTGGTYSAVIEAVNDNFYNCSSKSGSVSFTSKSAPSKLSATGLVYPTEVVLGKAFSLKGTIVSNYNITYVKVSIVGSDGTEKIVQTRNPNTKSFSISEVDDDIPFGRLSAGKYIYKIEASDESGTSKVLHTNNFNVGKTAPTIPVLKLDNSAKDGKVIFSWGSTANTTSYNLYIYNSSGSTVLTENKITDSSYEASLDVGTYTAQLEAVNDNFYDCSSKSEIISFVVEKKTETNPGEIFISGAEVKAGDIVRLAVYIENNPGISSFDLNIKYDSGSVSPLSVSNGRVMTSGTVSSNIDSASNGSFNVRWLGDSDIYEDGTIFYVTFSVLSTTELGTYPIELSYGNGGIYSSDKNSNVDMGLSHSSIIVTKEADIDVQDMTASVLSIPSFAYSNEKFYMEIETSSNVSAVKLYNENNDVISSTVMSKTKNGDKIVWKLYTAIGTTGPNRTITICTRQEYGDFTDIGCKVNIEIKKSGILSVIPEKDNFPVGDNIVVNAVTTRDLIKFSFKNENLNAVGYDILSKSVNSDGTTSYRCRLNIQTEGERKITMLADVDGSSNFPYSQSFYLNINSAAYIYNAEFSASSVKKDETVDLTVVTSKKVSKILIFNENNNKIGASLISKTENSSGNNVFVYRMSFGTAGNNRHLYVKALNTDGNDTNDVVVANIDVIETSPKIYSVNLSKSSVNVNEPITITVNTNDVVNSLKIQNDNGTTMGCVMMKTYNNNGTITWTCSMSIGTSGNKRPFYISGSNSNGNISNTVTTYINVL